MIGGNDLDTPNMSALYCSAYGNGTFIVRGFGPAPFSLSARAAEANAAIKKAAVGQPVTQEIALSVKGDKVECAVNGTVVGSYDKAAVVGAGKLKSTDGVYGLRFGHNTEADRHRLRDDKELAARHRSRLSIRSGRRALQPRRPFFVARITRTPGKRFLVASDLHASRWLAVLLVLLRAQRGGVGGRFRRSRFRAGPARQRYDSRFMLARLYYACFPAGLYDWPDMEQHLGSILDDLTVLRANHRATTCSAWTIRNLLKYPVAYLSEPGFWYPTDEEAAGLRTFLHKGGFLIVDDFHFAEEWAVFEIGDPRGAAGRAHRSARHLTSRLQFVLPDQVAGRPVSRRLGEMGLMGEFYGIHETTIRRGG